MLARPYAPNKQARAGLSQVTVHILEEQCIAEADALRRQTRYHLACRLVVDSVLKLEAIHPKHVKNP